MAVEVTMDELRNLAHELREFADGVEHVANTASGYDVLTFPDGSITARLVEALLR